MGNLESLSSKTTEEFNRALTAANSRNTSSGEHRDYLVLQEVLQLHTSNITPKEYDVELTHLGALFVLDVRKDGRFCLDNFLEFVKLGFERDAASNNQSQPVRSDFQTQFKGHCTWIMWNTIEEKGKAAFEEWFSALLSENEEILGDRKKLRGVHPFPGNYLSRGTIVLMHKILNIKKAYGVNTQKLFDMMQRAAEEQDVMALDQEELDDFVPLIILRQFAIDFIQGFTALMSDLGFEPEYKKKPDYKKGGVDISELIHMEVKI
ncbi:EF hand domain containing protein [Balamuthia mandrillaris]